MPIVPRWSFPAWFLGLLGKYCLDQSLVDRVHWVAIPFRVLVIFLIVHRSISLFPCAIGVSHPVFDLVLDEVSDAGPAIAVDTLTVKPCVIIIVRPCGQKNDSVAISAILNGVVVVCAVHVSIPHGPFLLLGRTDVGAVARSSDPH